MSTKTRKAGAHHFFSRHGVLSKWHPNYEYRPGQLDMAEAVESALQDRKHLIAEAGTGTGKTLAYLVPAILSGRRIIVSTGTKNLQEQLYLKDIPFLQQRFETPLEVCYMKGRGNYACRQKIYDADREPILTGLEETADFQIIREWEKTTEFDAHPEMKTLPEHSAAWAKLDARRDLCAGQKCPQFQRCFLTLMHQRAMESDIIIVNHHLFFADLALKDEDFGGGILPEYHAVVFDEAHELEDIAGQYFGVHVSSYRFEELRRDISALARAKKVGSPELDRALDSMSDAATMFFNCLPQNEGRASFAGRTAFLNEYQNVYREVLLAIELVGSSLKLINDA